ncbi:MAG: Fe(2+)-trafficking protein [Phycisphaerales bacterium]|nr:Fe(2+)-trafficking protein [Planctomycetota bacterium]MCZ6542848.1 Fe(2+)-trafficking protein [Planctomycetota bacterium]MCZ6611868.1 Fe(2+)-trafficking protein [Planctomycetota bacterium]
MSNPDERIAQFEHMAAEDPDNAMAHFSLGSAYIGAQRHADAAASFQRCIELNSEMSKAYQLAAAALIDSGDEDRAAEILITGYEVAARRGDMMPKNAIAELLKRIGREPPKLSDSDQAKADKIQRSDVFTCQHTGRPGTQLPEPPMRGALGQWIYEHISSETWGEWIGQGTKVINELRLDFSREQDQRVFDEHMCEFLGIDDTLYEQLMQKA